MRHKNRWAFVMLCLTALLLTACREQPKAEKVEPAIVQAIPGSEFSRVILTADAARRLDIRTAPVAEDDMLFMPYSAVIYGVFGETWAYTNPEPLTYVRYPVVVDHIDGELAMLVEGPPVGTEVVTVGVAELFGAEVGVGK